MLGQFTGMGWACNFSRSCLSAIFFRKPIMLMFGINGGVKGG